MFLDQQAQNEIKKRFANLVNPVKIINFTQSLECQYCKETRQILEELTALSDKLSLEVFNFISDKEQVEKYNIDKIPATVIASPDVDYGIRYYGIPSGYEFASLLESIEMVSTQTHELSDEVAEQVKMISEPVHIQVFVTPTCPYCPRAVYTGHQLAFLNKNIKADMVEATEFPHLSMKYNVRGVPRVVINETHHFEGALPDEAYVEEVLKALDTKQS
ncbi:MAG: thioredoxin family protein [Bacteroidetes bacterium]|nr:thioredoxin family protein [Bacteroidota bacterium]